MKSVYLFKFLNKFRSFASFLKGFLFLIFLFLSSTLYAQTTYYTFQSGNFNDINVWTEDPSGTLLINSAVPSNGDDLVILVGRTVTVNQNNLSFASVIIEESAQVDLGTTTGHNLGTVSGRGTLSTESSTLPTGTYTAFYGSNGGILEFTGNSNITLPNEATLHSLTISGTGIKTLAHNLTLSGNLLVESGNLRVGNSTTDRSLTVEGDITIESSGTLSVGSFNADHTITLSGSLFNNGGTVTLDNNGSPHYTSNTTSGTAIVEMIGNSNEQIVANGVIIFNRLIINKGNDQTYEVEATSNNSANFLLYGRNNEGNGSTSGQYSASNPEIRKALWVRNGTFRVRSQIAIESLTEGGNDFFIPENAQFWVDGADFYSTLSSNGTSNQGTTVYGTFRISNGSFDSRNSAGIVFRDNGTVLVEGGTVRISQFRRSGTGSGSNFTSYIQTGGTFIVDGNGENNNSVGRFGINQPESVFRMSGGILRLEDNNGAADGGLQIDSDPANFSVSGGTVEIIPNGGDFEIGTNAPLYNVVMFNGANNVVLNRDLVVINDLTINSGTNLNSQNNNLSVGRNFNLAGTYTAGSNTTTFNGSGNANLSITNGSTLTLNNFTIDKNNNSTDTLFVSNAQPIALLINGNFEHLNGVTDLGNFRIDLNGNLTINSQLGLQGNAGELLMSGSVSQTISIPIISINPIITRLEINNGSGVSLSGGDLTILNDVQLQTGIFDIDVHELVANGGISTSGTFSNALMIQTAGNNTDGGLSVELAGNSTVLYPLGIGADYTPFTLTLSNWIDAGIIQVNPSNQELATLNPVAGDALQFYWRVRHRQFANLPDITYEMVYPNSAVSGNEANYVAGKVVGSTRSTDDPGGPADNVDEGTNTITFDDSGSGAFTLENASYTAAESSRFGGSVRILYSRARNNNRNATFNLNQVYDWHDANSWTEDSTTNVPASSPPGPGDIVIVTYGGNHNPNGGGNRHHIIIENHTGGVDAEAAEVIVRNGSGIWASRLYIRQNAEANLGTVRGRGDVWYLVTDSQIPNVTADYGEFAQTNGARFNYLRQGGSYITFPTSPTIFPTVRIEANTPTRFTWPVDVQINFDLIVDNRSILQPTNNITVLNRFFIGGFQEGILEFPSDEGPINVEVFGNITLRNDNDSEIRSENAAPSPATLEHNLILHSDLYLTQGSIDLYDAGRSPINLEFRGTGSNAGYPNLAFFTNSTGNVPDLFRLIVNKTNPTDSVFIQTDFNLMGPSNTSRKSIDLQRGFLVLDNSNIDITISDGGANFPIPANTGLSVNQGTVRVGGNNNFGVLLGGTLAVNGGDVLLGENDANDNHFIEYSNTGNSTINVTAGNLIVGSQIRRDFITTTGILNYTQTGGNVEVGRYTVPNNQRGTFEILNGGSSFTHTGGDLVIVREQPNGNVPGFIYAPSSVNATAPIQIGNANTPNSETIFINASQPIGQLIVSGAPTSLTAQLQVNPLVITNNLTVETGATFNANSLDVTLGGNFTNNGTFNGTNANVTFNGTGAQNGAINSVTTFHDLTIDKPSGTLSLSGAGNTTVTNDFFLLNGTFDDGGKTIGIQGDITNSAIHVGAGRLELNGSSVQNMFGNGSGVFQNLELNNANGFITHDDFQLNGSLTFTLGILNIDEFGWTFGTSSSVSGTPSNTRMIRLDGSLNAAGVSKIVGTGSSNFTFPIGVSNKYTPANYNFASNTTQGTVTVRPVNITQTSATDGGDDLLDYYWLVTTSGFGSFNVTHQYTYDQTDVQTATSTEADYVWGRFNGGVWSQGATTDVNTTTNVATISNVNFLNGDYSVGDPAEFGVLATYYSSSLKGGINAAPGASWNDLDTWSTVPWNDPQHGLLATRPSQPPSGNQVNILSGHYVFIPTNSARAGGVEINGTLDLGSTTSHILGEVTGTGTLINGSTTVVFPSGDFSNFLGANGGTVLYNAASDFTLPSQNQYWNLIVESTSNRVRILPAITLTVLNNVEIRGNARLDANNRTIRVRGDWINNSSNITPFQSGTGSTVIFDGSSDQTIGGTSATTFRNITINNNQTGNVLSNNMTVNGNITIQSGRLNLNGRTITLSPTASLSETSGNLIYGTTGQITTFRNLSANPGNVGGLGFNVSSTDQAPGNTTLTRRHSAVVDNGLTSILRWYEFNPTTNSGLNATLVFNYDDTELNGRDENSFVLYRDAGSGNWTFRGGIVNTSANTVTLSNIDAFSPWTVDEAGSLPIELASFTIVPNLDFATIKWTTSIEWENYGFYVERAFINEQETIQDTAWTELAFIEGMGTITEPIDYEYTDRSLSQAGSYVYRLKQMDFDGSVEIHGPIEFNFSAPDNFELFQNYPNPFNPTTVIPFNVSNRSKITVQVYDILGRLVTTLTDRDYNPGRYELQFNGSRYSSGMYLIRMSTDGRQFVKKMLLIK